MSEDQEKTIREEDTMKLAQANNHLAFNLHRLLAKDKQNVFFSPFSISTTMAMLICASEGETESEMMSGLGYDHAAIKRESMASIFDQQMSILLKNPDSYTLCCANSVLSQKDFNIKDEYKEILADSFKALLVEVDFKKENEKAINQINDWVKEKTNNMIPKVAHSLDPRTVLVLFSAVYFKGAWKKKFLKRSTFPQKFYNNGLKENAKEIDMMHMKKKFLFYEDKHLQVLKLPYFGEEVAMLILLPCAKDGLESMEASLSTSSLEDLKKKLRKKKVEITLPRFRLECAKSLVPCFLQLGIKRIFSRGAELGVASSSPDLLVSDILHKAVLEVNEEGSVAAAITMAKIELQCETIDPVFTANHPFMFIIYDTRSDLILFIGRVNEL